LDEFQRYLRADDEFAVILHQFVHVLLAIIAAIHHEHDLFDVKAVDAHGNRKKENK
jgi:hypothetical protein